MRNKWGEGGQQRFRIKKRHLFSPSPFPGQIGPIGRVCIRFLYLLASLEHRELMGGGGTCYDAGQLQGPADVVDVACLCDGRCNFPGVPLLPIRSQHGRKRLLI